QEAADSKWAKDFDREASARTARMPGATDPAPARTALKTTEKPGMARRAAAGATRLARRAANSPLGRAGVAGAGIGAALTGFDTPTEQYRERFGMETDDPSLAGDLTARTLGVASDLGNALTLGFAGRFYRDLQGGEEAPQ